MELWNRVISLDFTALRVALPFCVCVHAVRPSLHLRPFSPTAGHGPHEGRTGRWILNGSSISFPVAIVTKDRNNSAVRELNAFFGREESVFGQTINLMPHSRV